MNKKNRPLQAANSDIRVSDVTPLTKSLQAPKRTPKKHRARVYMLRTGIEGWTENDILRYCRLSSGRNYATELEASLESLWSVSTKRILMVSEHTFATVSPAVVMF